MKRIICFSPEDENLSLLLAAWVKVMKPRRADFLKEMKRSDNPLLLEVSYKVIILHPFYLKKKIPASMFELLNFVFCMVLL